MPPNLVIGNVSEMPCVLATGNLSEILPYTVPGNVKEMSKFPGVGNVHTMKSTGNVNYHAHFMVFPGPGNLGFLLVLPNTKSDLLNCIEQPGLSDPMNAQCWMVLLLYTFFLSI